MSAILKRIAAKIILRLPLTQKEYALWILYGDENDIRKFI